mgnify:CR=1 FL=1
MGIRRVENMCGGKGHVIIKDILEGDELKGKCGLYAQVTIEKDVLWDTMSIMARQKPTIS